MHAVAEAPTTSAPRAVRQGPGIAKGTTPNLPRTYTWATVLEMFDVSKRTIQRWQAKRGFPPTKSFGHSSQVFLADDVDGWARMQLGIKE